MRHAVAVTWVFALFLMGIVIGAFGMHLFESHQGPWHPRSPAAGHRGMGPPPHVLEGMMDEVELSADQRERVRILLAEGRHKAEALRHEISPQVQAQMEEMHRQIMEVLTPEQRRQVEGMHPRLRQFHPEH
jgi:Spy/CpxP family protein refolding chaperone